MKLLIFGATGGTGRQLVAQALAQGHDVTGFARGAASLGISHPNLSLISGDVTDATAVQRVVPGHDAVLCAIGAPAWVRTTVRADGTRNIVDAMERAGVRRLVCQSSLGIGDSSKVALPFYLKRLVIPIMLRHGFADHERQEQIVAQSELDWTIVRPATMTAGERTGDYRRGFPADAAGIKIKISRADVADFMLEQLTTDGFVRQSPLAVVLAMARVVLIAHASAVVGCGLTAGLFFAFSVSVLRGLTRLPAPQAIAAMQSFNVAIVNPAFFLVFFGTAAACLVLAATSVSTLDQPHAAVRLAGALLFVVGAFVVTVVFSVPLNNALAAVDPQGAAGSHLWERYASQWTAWNHVRALAACLFGAMNPRGEPFGEVNATGG